MNHLDLCSGIGGFALAARWMGWQTIGFAEIDPFASKVLEKHWPGVPNYGDIRLVPDGIRADILTAGFPCQPYSCAGKQLGEDDDRAIWPLVIEVVRRVQPSWAVFENVPGIINLALDGVLSDLEAENYEVGTVILPACAVNAPHRRDRVWIVANVARDTDRARPQRRISAELRERSDERATGQGGPFTPNADREPMGRATEPRRQRGGGQLEPGLGGDFARVSSGMDGPFGSGPERWDGDWERGVPRVAKGAKDRAKRLKALGNAIVPQVAYQIFRSLSVSADKDDHERVPV